MRFSPRTSLTTSVGLWITLAALLGLSAQIARCLYRDLGPTEELARHFVVAEARRIVDALFDREGRLSASLEDLTSRYGRFNGYAFVVRDEAGRVVAAREAEAITREVELARIPASGAGQLWMKRLPGDGFLYVGGVQQMVGDRKLSIELGTVKDPWGFWLRAMLDDIIEDALEPIAIATLIQLFLAMVAIRWALHPLLRVENQVNRLGSVRDMPILDVEGLPREAASFASAINKLVAKSTDLLATQEQMTGIILHEMRRPMTSMMLELERHGGPRPMTLKAELVRLSAITERLLEVARSRGEVERGRLEIVDLAASARRAVEVLSPQAQARGCRLSLTQDGGAPFTGLTGVVDEALVNVVENAIKHSPPHSVVEVSCGPGRSVTISDSGNGLSDEHVERLFQAFERGPTEADGWGLGLMIVKQAVELHGGKVEVGRSRLGGARFTLSFESILAEPPADQARSRLTGAERSERTIESADH